MIRRFEARVMAALLVASLLAIPALVASMLSMLARAIQ